MRSLAKFFLLTFSATWILWIASLAMSQEIVAHPTLGLLTGAVFLLGVFVPALVALALTDRVDGRAATQSLLSRIFKWDVGWRWYLFALAYIPVVKLSVALVHRLMIGAWSRFGQTPWYLMARAIAVSIWVQAGEEIGWRGYVLPHLSKHFGLVTASVTLGIIWATWHLPLFFFPGSDILGQSFRCTYSR